MKTNVTAQQQDLRTNVRTTEEKEDKKEESTQEQMFKALMDL